MAIHGVSRATADVDLFTVEERVLQPKLWRELEARGAEMTSMGEVSVKVARPAGLVLLKLYAGGPKDAWDIRSLLEATKSRTPSRRRWIG